MSKMELRVLGYACFPNYKCVCEKDNELRLKKLCLVEDRQEKKIGNLISDVEPFVA